MSELTWVSGIRKQLDCDLEFPASGTRLIAEQGRKLPYVNEVYSYDNNGHPKSRATSYETDLLISDVSDAEQSVPRVVIECKLGSITTHDALTYSTKASTHKHVHPYLRYGILVGARQHYAIPGRLVRHGAHFDFMIAWKAAEPDKAEWKSFVDVLTSEVRASRALQELLETARSSKRMRYHLVHRPLRLESHPESQGALTDPTSTLMVRGPA